MLSAVGQLAQQVSGAVQICSVLQNQVLQTQLLSHTSTAPDASEYDASDAFLSGKEATWLHQDLIVLQAELQAGPTQLPDTFCNVVLYVRSTQSRTSSRYERPPLRSFRLRACSAFNSFSHQGWEAPGAALVYLALSGHPDWLLQCQPGWPHHLPLQQQGLQHALVGPKQRHKVLPCGQLPKILNDHVKQTESLGMAVAHGHVFLRCSPCCGM